MAVLGSLGGVRDSSLCPEILVGDFEGTRRHTGAASFSVLGVVWQDNPEVALSMALHSVHPLAWEPLAAWLLEGGKFDQSLQALVAQAQFSKSNATNGNHVRSESRSG